MVNVICNMFRVASKKVLKGDLLHLLPRKKVLKEVKTVSKSVLKKDVK